MAQLQIGERVIEVDDSFLALPPQEQQKAVDEIEQSLGTTEQPQMDWADVPGQALQKRSRKRKGIWEESIHPILHPVQTVESLASAWIRGNE